MNCDDEIINLECNNKNNAIEVENESIENWRGQATPNISTPKNRSIKSYLNKQPNFEHVDFSKKGHIQSIMHLKNGNKLLHKPILLPGVGKLLLSNTFLAEFIIQMISGLRKNNIYKDRAILLFEHYENNVNILVGGFKQIDIIDTLKIYLTNY